jgi:hypothetical protein
MIFVLVPKLQFPEYAPIFDDLDILTGIEHPPRDFPPYQ